MAEIVPYIHSCVTRESAEATWRGTWTGMSCPRGTAEATFIDGIWYVNRVLVQPQELRGRGIGTRLLQTLIRELRDKAGAVLLVVDPGGYAGDTARQRRFYKKNGFVPDHKIKGRMILSLRKEDAPDDQ